MRVYYNEVDPYCCGWLENLIAEKLIPRGDVDRRSIADVEPGDVAGYDQCHFFAGIAGWAYALELAGWGEEPVWTGSCPCQPFSAAGKRKGTADSRHLWPQFRWLIEKCQPATVLGEQVASKDGRQWFVGVRSDLEALGYAVGAADLCAAGAGAPHIRQRLYWVADTAGMQGRRRDADDGIDREEWLARQTGSGGDAGGVADAMQPGWTERGAIARNGSPAGSGGAGRLADADQRQCGRLPDGEGCLGDGAAAGRIEGDCQLEPGGVTGGLGNAEHERSQRQTIGSMERPSIAAENGSTGFWSDFHVVHCTDGKARRVEPGTFPLANGVPNRVGRLCAYGNAIVPQVAAEFIRAFKS